MAENLNLILFIVSHVSNKHFAVLDNLLLTWVCFYILFDNLSNIRENNKLTNVVRLILPLIFIFQSTVGAVLWKTTRWSCSWSYRPSILGDVICIPGKICIWSAWRFSYGPIPLRNIQTTTTRVIFAMFQNPTLSLFAKINFSLVR